MSDYSLNDLLDLLDTEEPEKAPLSLFVPEGVLKDFCLNKKIQEGVDRIPNYVIYYTYKEVYGGDLSKIEFFRQFNKHFKQRRTGKQRYYQLDGGSFDMTHEGKVRAEFFDKEYNAQRKKQKTKTKKKEV